MGIRERAASPPTPAQHPGGPPRLRPAAHGERSPPERFLQEGAGGAGGGRGVVVDGEVLAGEDQQARRRLHRERHRPQRRARRGAAARGQRRQQRQQRRQPQPAVLHDHPAARWAHVCRSCSPDTRPPGRRRGGSAERVGVGGQLTARPARARLGAGGTAPAARPVPPGPRRRALAAPSPAPRRVPPPPARGEAPGNAGNAARGAAGVGY